LRNELRNQGYRRVDAVVSSLALGLMAHRQRCVFLKELVELLGETGVFTQYQYFHGLQVQSGKVKRFDLDKLLRRYFRFVKRRVVLRNLPPAFVYVCRGPLTSEAGKQPHARSRLRGRLR
jgi:phospholipid N-methyltransferase